MPRSQTIDELQERLREIESSHRRPADEAETLSTEIEALDRLLPAGGIRPGALVEWLGAGDGSGAGTLALMTAKAALRDRGALVVVDPQREFYPPAAAALGIDLDRMIVVQPTKASDVIWAFEQSLRCQGVAAAACWLGPLDDRVFRRLQLAAEVGGTMGLLLRPEGYRAEPSWADVRLFVRPLSKSQGRRLRVELLHCRTGTGGEAVELDICDETGAVRVASQLAAPTAANRRSRA